MRRRVSTFNSVLIPLLIAIGMIVVHAAGERKAGRGRGDQEVERHLLPGTRHKTETTFSYIPTKPYIFLHSRTIHNHRALLSGDQQSGRGWRRGLGNGHCAVARASRAILHPSSAWPAILHNFTWSFIILHDPTQSYTTLRPYLHVSKSYSSAAIQHFPAIHLKFAKTCWKTPFHLKPKPSHVDTRRKRDMVQIFCKSLSTSAHMHLSISDVRECNVPHLHRKKCPAFSAFVLEPIMGTFLMGNEKTQGLNCRPKNVQIALHLNFVRMQSSENRGQIPRNQRKSHKIRPNVNPRGSFA